MPEAEVVQLRLGEGFDSRKAKIMRLAGRIRWYALENKNEPAREAGRTRVTIRAKTAHEGLELDNLYPAVCGALDTDKLLSMAGMTREKRMGPHQSSTMQWVFSIEN